MISVSRKFRFKKKKISKIFQKLILVKMPLLSHLKDSQPNCFTPDVKKADLSEKIGKKTVARCSRVEIIPFLLKKAILRIFMVFQKNFLSTNEVFFILIMLQGPKIGISYHIRNLENPTKFNLNINYYLK